MNTGMLWFDNDPRIDLLIKVERAAIYFQKKYGRSPTLCYVHPSMVAALSPTPDDEGPIKSGGVEIRTNKSVLPNHFWIGVNGLAAS